jgi:hypothetical protein
LNLPDSEKLWFWLFERNQNERTVGFKNTLKNLPFS